MNTNEQAPFDPIYDEDNPYRTEIPERFVYDAELDEHGLAEMPGVVRDAYLAELQDFWAEVVSEQWDDDPNPYDDTYSEI